MQLPHKIEWSALEYEERERNQDWFWALGVIVFASSASAIIYCNYFFGALIIIGGIMLGYLATKPQDLIHYELNPKGLKVESRIYTYENIKSFWAEPAGEKLFVKTERVYMPVLSIPIENIPANISREDIRGIFLEKQVPEEEMREHPAHAVMEFFGF